MIYVPVTLDEAGRPADIRMIRLEDGRVALLGYTALDRFVDCCGPEQPWMLLEAGRLDDVRAAKPFDLTLLDVALPEDFRPRMQESVR